jgi:hypothetical protein
MQYDLVSPHSSLEEEDNRSEQLELVKEQMFALTNTKPHSI